MKSGKILLLAIFTFCVVGIALEAQSMAPTPIQVSGPMLGDVPNSEATAHAVRNATRFEAHADFWLKVADILNGPWEEISARVEIARAEHREDLDQAEAQFETRLALNREFGFGPYDPVIDPSAFTPAVTNTFMPCVPGRTLVYEGRTAEGQLRKEITALAATAVIGGLECRVVREVETLDGKLVVDSVHWFAQHKSGDVWYFGEVAKHYVDGFLDSLDGSWRFGKDGAKLGIVMLASPATGDIYRQQFHLNVAEDIARVVAFGTTASVPCGVFHECVTIENFSPLELDDVDNNVYAPGVGLVVEIDVTSGARVELVQIIK
jgi:hypothetical protein